jgi:recombination protein RecT
METNTKTQPPVKTNGQAVATVERNIADNVLNKIKIFQETGSLNLPKEYSAANALRVAWLILLETKNLDKKPVLEVCSKESIANALLKMIIQGLNPLKRQCSFIAYGNVLTCQREYAGTIAIAKRDAGVKKVFGMAVFKGDTFEFVIDPETKKKKVSKHVQTIENLETGLVVAAYAVKEYEDGSREEEIMSMSQIRTAWNQGPMKGQSPAHKNFPDQMAIKTVINRLLKIDVNSSDDSALMDYDVPPGDDQKMADVKYQIEENSNKKEISMEETHEHEEADIVSKEAEKHVDTETGEVVASAQRAPF